MDKGWDIMSDVVLIAGLMLFFILLGAVLPYTNELDNTFINYQLSTGTAQYDDDAEVSTGSMWKTFGSILSIFVWSFNLGTWGNLFLMIPRVILALLIYRQVRSGAG